MRITPLIALPKALIAGVVFSLITLSTTLAPAAGGFPQPSICSRSCWGARSAAASTQMAALTRATIHHTAGASDWNTTTQATSAAKVRAIQNLHMDVNGWADVGYHFLFDKLGNRFEGRLNSIASLPRGAHDAVNTNSMGFTLMGYCHTPYNDAPPLVARNAMYDTIAWKMPTGFTGFGGGAYGDKASVGFLCGHRDVGSTACPGDTFYPYIGTNLNAGEARTAVNSRITGGGSVEVIVDNATTAFTASTNWFPGTSISGFYGTNYHARATGSVSDSATFKGAIPSDGNWEVYVRHTAASNRATATPFIVYHTGGSTTTYVNQTINNGVWISIGTYNMYQGSTATRVAVSCWTSSGGYVIADAVKFVKR